MTKKNLKPQQAAPVQREINTTSSMGRDGAIAPSEWTRDLLKGLKVVIEGG